MEVNLITTLKYSAGKCFMPNGTAILTRTNTFLGQGSTDRISDVRHLDISLANCSSSMDPCLRWLSTYSIRLDY